MLGLANNDSLGWHVPEPEAMGVESLRIVPFCRWQPTRPSQTQGRATLILAFDKALARISHSRPVTRSQETAGTAQTPNIVKYSLAFCLPANLRPMFRHGGRLLVAGLRVCEKCGLARLGRQFVGVGK